MEQTSLRSHATRLFRSLRLHLTYEYRFTHTCSILPSIHTHMVKLYIYVSLIISVPLWSLQWESELIGNTMMPYTCVNATIKIQHSQSTHYRTITTVVIYQPCLQILYSYSCYLFVERAFLSSLQCCTPIPASFIAFNKSPQVGSLSPTQPCNPA